MCQAGPLLLLLVVTVSTSCALYNCVCTRYQHQLFSCWSYWFKKVCSEACKEVMQVGPIHTPPVGCCTVQQYIGCYYREDCRQVYILPVNSVQRSSPTVIVRLYRLVLCRYHCMLLSCMLQRLVLQPGVQLSSCDQSTAHRAH